MSAFFSKILAILMSILAFFGINIGNKGQEIKVDDTVNAVVEGTEIDFSMTANGSTGYTWTYELKGDAVKFVKQEYKEIDRGPIQLVGAPGTQHFYFKAQKPGTAEITFTYSRSFENNSTINVCTATVTVADDMTVTVE